MNLKRKVCLLGATGVGKTSLVARYVRSIFSETYRTTIGVKIETRRIQRGDDSIDLVIWDLSGEDEFQEVQFAYLRGVAGYLLVVDATRRATVETGRRLLARANHVVGRVPMVFVVNKCDLGSQWDLDDDALASFSATGWPVVRTSARTGAGVEAAFDALVAAMTGTQPRV